MTQPRAIDQAWAPAASLGHAALALGVCVACATGNSSPMAHRWSGALVGLVAGWQVIRGLSVGGRARALRRATRRRRTGASRGPAASRRAAVAIRVALFIGLILSVASGLVLGAAARPDGTGPTALWSSLHDGLVDATLLVIAVHIAAVARTRKPGGHDLDAAQRTGGRFDAPVGHGDSADAGSHGLDHGSTGA